MNPKITQVAVKSDPKVWPYFKQLDQVILEEAGWLYFRFYNGDYNETYMEKGVPVFDFRGTPDSVCFELTPDEFVMFCDTMRITRKVPKKKLKLKTRTK